MIFQPFTSFHFVVAFELFPQLPQDLHFQEVSGLSSTIETETLLEGGENRFAHKLPKRPSYQPLQLKRGLLQGSGLVHWCKNAIENFNFRPTNVVVTLLNEKHLPIMGWRVMNAYPTKWEVARFNAEQSEIAIETMEFEYQYFKSLRI